jgi:lysophospholipid acyltransferase (LPLAT)-like uncharacterized protein
MMKRLVRHPAVQAMLARLLGCYLAFALRTTRWRVDGEENLAALIAGEPHIVAFWHERLPLMPMPWLMVHRLPRCRTRPMHLLVSHHRDGRFIAAVLRRFEADVVLGSSSRGGAAGLRRLLGLLRDGGLVGITPDGPRGPRRQAALGVAQLAALSGAPVLPCAAQTSRRWVLRSWDRMVIPRPFGRGVVVYGPVIAVAREGWREVAPVIGAALTAAVDRADQLCPA